MKNITLTLHADYEPLKGALALLAEAAQCSPEIVDSFLSSLDSAAQLVRLDIDDSRAIGACDFRIVLQPSNCLVEFLAAIRTGERDDV